MLRTAGSVTCECRFHLGNVCSMHAYGLMQLLAGNAKLLAPIMNV